MIVHVPQSSVIGSDHSITHDQQKSQRGAPFQEGASAPPDPTRRDRGRGERVLLAAAPPFLPERGSRTAPSSRLRARARDAQVYHPISTD